MPEDSHHGAIFISMATNTVIDTDTMSDSVNGVPIVLKDGPKRCRTCKHFNIQRTHEPWESKRGVKFWYGECRNVFLRDSIFQRPDTDNRCLSDGPVDVSENFGCIHHEEK